MRTEWEQHIMRQTFAKPRIHIHVQMTTRDSAEQNCNESFSHNNPAYAYNSASHLSLLFSLSFARRLFAPVYLMVGSLDMAISHLVWLVQSEDTRFLLVVQNCIVVVQEEKLTLLLHSPPTTHHHHRRRRHIYKACISEILC